MIDLPYQPDANDMLASRERDKSLMATQLTPKELAVRFDTDARTLRKFLRSTDGKDMRVGKGQRWAIEAREVKSLKRRFDAWVARKAQNTTTPEEVTEPTESD